jgi:alpha-galactosidase
VVRHRLDWQTDSVVEANDQLLHLHDERLSVVIDTQGNVPAIVYWGNALGARPLQSNMFSRAVLGGGIDLDPPLGIIPQQHDGWLGTSGIEGCFQDGSGSFPYFVIESITHTTTSATFILRDVHLDLGLELNLKIHTSGVLAIVGSFTNYGSLPYLLHGLRFALPVPSRAEELLTFGGRWGMEFGEQRTLWMQSTISISNGRGRTSHEKWPVVFAGTAQFGEQHGEVWGCHVGWSGNFEMTFDGVTEHRKHMLVGEKLVAGEVVLQPQETYSAPTIYTVHSSHGLSSASQQFHQFVRSQLRFKNKSRPVTLNTWEAVYFDHNFETLNKLADAAARVGVERFVLDDGWFSGRRNDKVGLGDWTIDSSIWPNGLTPLINHVKSLGMEFGIWCEPEMVNPDSDLYRKHPDWVLHHGANPPITGRNQLVLDLSRSEVREYVFTSISQLLDAHDISYVKWDHNRDLVASPAHEQTCGTYELLGRLKQTHPQVQFESCASGGGRIDFGILPFVDRFWTSDSIDPLDRILIQLGAQRLMPPEVLGSHIGSPTSHITRRSHSLAFRASTAFFGWLGVEWNLLNASPHEQDRLASVIAQYKELRQLLHTGKAFREDHSDSNIVVQGVSAHDQSWSLVSVTRLANGPSSHINRIQIHHLDEDVSFTVSPLHLGTPTYAPHRKLPQWIDDGSITMTGRQLQEIGVTCPPLLPASSFLIQIHKVKK